MSYRDNLMGNPTPLDRERVDPNEMGFMDTTRKMGVLRQQIATQEAKEGEDNFVRSMNIYQTLVDSGATQAAKNWFDDEIAPVAQDNEGKMLFEGRDTSNPEFHKQLSGLWKKSITKEGQIANKDIAIQAAQVLARQYPNKPAPGELQIEEYTGDTLTGQRSVKAPVSQEPVAQKTTDTEVLPGITSQMIQDRANELAQEEQPRNLDEEGLPATREQGSVDEFAIEAKLQLAEEAIAQKYGVSPDLVRKFTEDRMDETDEDPENIFADILKGKLEFKPNISPEIMKIYTGQNLTKEEIDRLYQQKYGVKGNAATRK